MHIIIHGRSGIEVQEFFWQGPTEFLDHALYAEIPRFVQYPSSYFTRQMRIKDFNVLSKVQE